MREYTVPAWGSQVCELDARTASALRATGLVRIEVGPRGGEYVVRAGGRVGVAAGRDWQLRVISHLDVHELMFLLCFARDPKGWRRDLAQFGAADDLLSAVVWGFTATAETALSHGPLAGYRTTQERLTVLRGRMRFAEQAARGGMLTPVNVEHDEYDADIAANQILLATARLLLRLPLATSLPRRRLRAITRTLADVSEVPIAALPPAPAITRLNEHYRDVLVLGGLIVSGASISFESGDVSSVAFSFELHRVFEQFLGTALAEGLRRRGVELREQVRGCCLDHDGAIRLVPDLVAMRGSECVSVIDAKFKRLDANVGADAYQMLAYLLEFGPSRGFLVSAEGVDRDHEIRAVEKRISVRSVRLDQPHATVLRTIDGLTDEIVASDAGVAPRRVAPSAA